MDFALFIVRAVSSVYSALFIAYIFSEILEFIRIYKTEPLKPIIPAMVCQQKSAAQTKENALRAPIHAVRKLLNN